MKILKGRFFTIDNSTNVGRIYDSIKINNLLSNKKIKNNFLLITAIRKILYGDNQVKKESEE